MLPEIPFSPPLVRQLNSHFTEPVQLVIKGNPFITNTDMASPVKTGD